MSTLNTAIRVSQPGADLTVGRSALTTAFAADAIGYGFVLYSSGALMISLTERYSASRFDISLAFSLVAVGAGLGSMVLGPWLDRGRVRRIMLLGTVVFSFGFALASFTTNLELLTLCYMCLLGPGTAMISQSASAKLIADHCAQSGRALAIASVGVSLSGVVMPVACTLLLELWPVEWVLRLYALASLGLALPLIFSIKPQQNATGLASHMAQEAPGVAAKGYRTLLRDFRFWKLALVFGIAFCVIVVVIVHTLPRVIDSGAVGMHAAYVGSVIALLGLPTKLLLTRLADTERLPLLFCGAMLTQALGLLIFLNAASLFENIMGGAVFGVGMGVTQPCLAIFVVRVFGAGQVGSVMGLLAPFMYCIQVIGVPLAGRAYDELGNYDAVLTSCVAALALVTVIGWNLRGELRRPAEGA